jgi:hypothetical protein
MCFGGGAPSAPDVSAQAGESAAIGKQAVDTGKQQLDWTKGAVAQGQQNLSGVQGQLNQQGTQAFGGGTAAQDYFQQGVLPGMQQNLKQAQDWGSPQGVQLAQANAAATTGQAFNAARLNNQRQLGAYGIDPSTLRGGALNLNANLQQAGATGNAVFNAGQNRQMQGFGMTGQAIGQGMQGAGVGQGYTGQGAGMLGQGQELGNQTLSTSSGALTAPSQWSQVGLQGQGQSANILNQQFQNQLASYQASQSGMNSLMSGLGSVAGAGAMMMMADGGGISIPSIQIMPAQMVGIQPGAQYQAPQTGLGQGLQQGAQQAQAMQPRPQPGRMPAPPGDMAVDQLAAGSGIASGMLAGGVPGDMSAQRIPGLDRADGGRIPGLVRPPHMMPRMPSGQPHLQGIPTPNRMTRSPTMADGGCMPTAVSLGQGHLADGGSAHEQGTFVSQGASDGTGVDDQVPARVSVGEYVVPADVVHHKGKDFFDKLVAKYHTPAAQQRQQLGVPQRAA